MSDKLARTGPGECALLEFPKIADPRGNLTFVENIRHVPFGIRRVFYLYDVPEGQMRAAHALITCKQCIIAIAGSLDVIVDDGSTKQTYHLDRPNAGLYVPAQIWRELVNFTAGAVCLVLASELYDPADYFDDYDAFLKAIGGKHT